MDERAQRVIAYYGTDTETWSQRSPGPIATSLLAKERCDWLLFTASDLLGKRVLNVGGSFPFDEMKFSGFAVEWTAIDISPAVVKRQRDLFWDQLEGVRFETMDGAALAFPSESIDLYLSFSTIDHVPQEMQRLRHLREAYRVLRPGGIACISTEFVEFCQDGRQDSDTFGFTHLFTLSEFLCLCQAAGFDIYHIERMAGIGSRLGFRFRRE